MSITREQLKKRFERQSKSIDVDGDTLRIRKPSPLQWSQYQAALINPKTGQLDYGKMGTAQMNLVAAMLIDDDGKPLVDSPAELDQMDPEFYEQVATACISYASGKDIAKEAERVLGELGKTRDSSLLVESA